MSPAALLLSVALKATLLLALAAAVERAVLRRRASAAARHLLWSFALAGVLLLPLLAGTLPDWRLPLIPAASPAILPAARAVPPLASRPRDAQPDVTPAAAPSTAAAPSAGDLAESPLSGAGPGVAADAAPVPWVPILLAAYLAGVLLLLAKVAAEQLVVRRLARGAAPVEGDEWMALLRSLAAGLGVRRPVALLRSDAPTMPLTWGVLRPAVLLPAAADEWPASRRHAVLLHELAHVARHDCLTQTLAAVACALYWPHPGVWWAARRLRVEREVACDDQALVRGIRPVDYAGHLLELARGLRSPRALTSLAVSMASPSHLEMRLLAAIDGGRVRTAPGRRATLLGATLTALLLLPLSAMRASAAEEAAGAAVAAGTERASAATPAPAARRATRPPAAADSVAAVDSVAGAQEQYGGRWALRMATPAESEGRKPTVHVAMWTPGLNTFYVPLDQVDGLGAERIASSDGAVARFSLRRDPGTFAFEGTFSGGRGTGRFGFTPDPAFAGELARRGMERPTPRQQFSMARHGVGLAFLDELAAQGYARPTTATLERAGLSGADLAYLREMGALGYRLGTVDALVSLSNSGVDPRYVRELAGLGYRGLPAADLVRLRNSGADAAFVRQANASAGRQLPVAELASLRARGATAETLPAAAPAVPPASTASELVAMPHGFLPGAPTMSAFSADGSTPVTGRWIISAGRGDALQMELLWDDDTQWRRSIGLGAFSGVSAGNVASPTPVPAAFRIQQDAGTFDFEGTFHGGRGTGRFRFTPNQWFASVALRSVGIKAATDHQLKNLAYSGISTADVREFKALFPSLTMSELMDLAVRIVTPEYARTMRSLGVTGANTVRGVVELRFYNVPTAYVRELAGLGYRALSVSEVTEMWRIGVTAAFIRRVHDAGNRDVSADALIQMREREREERRGR